MNGKRIFLMALLVALVACDDGKLEQKQKRIQELDAEVGRLQTELNQVKAEARALDATKEELAEQERLIEKLKKKLDKSPATLVKMGNHTRILLPERLLFRSGEAQLAKSGIELLDQIAPTLKEQKGMYLLVAGHSDSQDIHPNMQKRFKDNIQLSAMRAWHVVDHLKGDKGVKMKMAIVGYGDAFPIAKNEISGGRQENRRVSLTLIPLRNRPK